MRHVVTDGDAALKFATLPGDYTRLIVGVGSAGLDAIRDRARGVRLCSTPDGETRASDPLLLYFTSGTTAKPKLVLHTHASYPVGHLSTMYWIGLREGDVHWNISSPGWAKHAWSSVFAPWNAGATIFIFDYQRFDARRVLDDDRALRRDDALRAAYRVAHAHRRGSRRVSRRAARAGGCR